MPGQTGNNRNIYANFTTGISVQFGYAVLNLQHMRSPAILEYYVIEMGSHECTSKIRKLM